MIFYKLRITFFTQFLVLNVCGPDAETCTHSCTVKVQTFECGFHIFCILNAALFKKEVSNPHYILECSYKLLVQGI